jgi:hypothetical protein
MTILPRQARDKHRANKERRVSFAGLLVGSDTYAYIVAPTEMTEKAGRWEALATQHGVSLPAVAIAFSTAPTYANTIVLYYLATT